MRKRELEDLLTERDDEIVRLRSRLDRPVTGSSHHVVETPRVLAVAGYAVALLFDNRAESMAVRSGDSFGALFNEYTGLCERAHVLKNAANGNWASPDLLADATKLAEELFE